MKQRITRSQTVEHKAHTALPRTVLTAAIIAAGTFSVYFVAKMQADAISMAVVAATFAISACISPVMSGMVGRASGAARMGFLAIAIGATILDAYGLGLAWQEREKAGPELAYQAELGEWEAETATDRQTVATIDAKMLTRVAPAWDAEKYVYGSRHERDVQAFNAESERLTDQRTAAQERLGANPKPERTYEPQPFVPVFLFALLAQVLISVASFAIAAHERACGIVRKEEPESSPAAIVKPQPVEYDPKVINLMERIGKQVKAA